MEDFTGKVPALILVLLFVGQVSAQFSIESSDPPRDYDVASPGAETVQVVRVLDGTGDPVNSSRMEDISVNPQYLYNSSYRDMEPLGDGYYYAQIESFTEEDILYRLENAGATSEEINLSAEIRQGQLGLESLRNISTETEAGNEIRPLIEVNDLATYHAVDTDDTEGVSEDDTYIRDTGGSGTFSSRADRIIAGSMPSSSVEIDTENPWSEVENPVAFRDSEPGDTWDPSSDSIVVDRDSGGTVSVQRDLLLSSGDGDPDTEPGTGLESLDSVRDEVYFASADQDLEKGEAIVYDNDSDGIYTPSPDQVIAGVEPDEGTTVTDQNTVPPSMQIQAYDAEDGDSWNPSQDALVIDRDDDGLMTATADLSLTPSSPSVGADLNTDTVEAWNDGDAQTATQGDTEVVDRGELDDPWDPDTDAIWLESGETNGFQPREDTVLAGSPEAGDTPNRVSQMFSQWEKISAYRADTDETFDIEEDSIVRESNGGGTFYKTTDTVVAGTSPESGAELTQIPSEWGIDAIDAQDGNTWDPSTDTLLLDTGDGGTFSSSEDEIINSGTTQPGINLVPLNSADDQKLWSDLDGNRRFSEGDEIFLDRDRDGQYTAQPDEGIAGISPEVLGAGTELEYSNPWSDVEEALLLKNVSEQGWNPGTDFIVEDLDQDSELTLSEDLIVQEGTSTPENGAGIQEAGNFNVSTSDVSVSFSTDNLSTPEVELGRNQNGTYSSFLEIPDRPNSTIVMQVHASSEAADTEGGFSRVIETRKQGIGISADEDIDLDIERAGVYETETDIENLLDTENAVSVEVSKDIEERVSTEDAFTIDPSETENLTVDINSTPMQDLEGEIRFTENSSELSDEIDVSVNSIDCPLQTERICAFTELVNVSATGRQLYERSLEVKNIWRKDTSEAVNAEITGEISSYSTLGSASFQLEDSRDLSVQMNPEDPGYYEGELVLSAAGSQLSVDLGLDANLQSLETGLSVDSQSEIGTVPEGSTASISAEVENTGNLEVRELSFTSGLDIDAPDPTSLDPGETRSFEMAVRSIDTTSGTVNVEGTTDRGNVSGSFTVTADPVRPKSEMVSDLRDRISDLRGEASSTETLNQITEVESKISSLQTQYDRGNYAEAKSQYQQRVQELESISVEESEPAPTPGTGTEQPPGDGGTTQGTGTGTTPGSGTDTPDGSKSSGSGMIIFAVLLLVILLIGFVLYTSYYPEEGDPLYGVLGE